MERHRRECLQGHSCGRALLHDTAFALVAARAYRALVAARAYRALGGRSPSSHRLFNPAPPAALLMTDL